MAKDIICSICGSEFRRRGKDAYKAKYCSKACYAVFQAKEARIGKWATAHRRGEYRNCEVCGKEFYLHPSWAKREGQGRFCSQSCTGKVLIKNLPSDLKGEKSPHWRGGLTSENEKIRKSREYELWRINVFERDNYTCVGCGQIGGNLNADHIKPFSLFPELRLELANGRTLCLECHKKTESYLNNKVYEKLYA